MSKKIVAVDNLPINVITQDGEDYISLTDRVRESANGSAIIENWLRNKNTLEFLSVWEEIYNPNFNSIEFEGIKNEAGLNRFTMSAKQWTTKTNAVGLMAKPGRYGGTYAQRHCI